MTLTGLFASRSEIAGVVPFSVLRKAGQPFLYLPGQSRAAACALQLYPAQTPPARLAKSVLRAAFQVHLPVPLERVSVPMDAGDAFVRFLSKLAGGKPVIAILAGNPDAEGRRFTILVFTDDGTPRAVVKAGNTEAARRLIAREEEFLRAVPESLRRGLPVVRDSFASGDVRAMAMDFVAGDSPRGLVRERLASLLSSWLNPATRVSLGEIPAWQRLMQHDSSLAKLSSQRVAPAMMHGDFAPWNVKVSSRDGAWTVLDWDRGERVGVPGWDWFHFEIQNAVLVRRWPAGKLAAWVAGLLGSVEFRQYGERAGIWDCREELVEAYLIYAAEVLRPTEGAGRLRELRAQLALARGGGRR